MVTLAGTHLRCLAAQVTDVIGRATMRTHSSVRPERAFNERKCAFLIAEFSEIPGAHCSKARHSYASALIFICEVKQRSLINHISCMQFR
jgi:hypothetical protein